MPATCREDASTTAPAVSVVIPTYNRGYCLARAVRSVLDQSFTDFELLVVDDASTDDTGDVLKAFGDPRLRILRHPANRGVSAAINTGIRHARAPLIAIQDSDDEWLPEKLARQVEVMNAADETLGVVYCDQWRFRDGAQAYFAAPHIVPADGIVFHRALDDALHDIGNQSLLIRRSCFEKAGLYDESLPRNVDLDMLIRISRHFHFHHIAEPLLNYYVTSDSVTKRGEAAGIHTQEVLFDKYLPDLMRNPALLAKRAYWIGSFHMRAGDAAKGRAYIVKALRAQPFNPRYIAAVLLSFLGCGAYRAMRRLT